jgi:UDP-N-acetylglucosamine acyltransferase
MSRAATIHPSAQVDPSAVIGEGVSIGAFSVVGADVEIGEGCRIDSHVVLEGPTRMGRDNRIHSFAVVGGAPQDKKYDDEPTRLEIGNGNTIREYVTINRGTSQDTGVTTIGDDNWIMAYVHIAHDCIVGNHTVLANNATLAGHVQLGDWVTLGGFTGIHQFCKVGSHAFIGMGSLINADVPPYVMVAGQYARPRGINSEGLKRRGFDAARIASIKRAYRTLFVSGRPLAEARAELETLAGEAPDIQAMLDFIGTSERSILR